MAAARNADTKGDYRIGDATKLPFDDDAADLVVAFMVLHDVDDLDLALRECARVLRNGGRLCAAIVHPLNSAGAFEGEAFVVKDSYLGERRYEDVVERDGLRMAFHSLHRPLEVYSRALESAGLLVKAMREPKASAPWDRVPLFLHILCVKS